MEELTTGYELSRNFFDWCFENPEKVKPNHIAMYFFIVEHWNRLGQKDKFGLPMEMTKDAIGIKNYKTYSKTFEDLVEWKFIKVLERSKNQYSANVIALVKNTKANTKALSKASLKHSQKQVQSIVGIDKPITIEPITYKTTLLSEIIISDFPEIKTEYFEIAKAFQLLFKNNLKEAGAQTSQIEKAKGTWIDDVRLIIEKDKYSMDDLREVYRFLQKDQFWKQNILSISKLREQIPKLKLKIHNGENRTDNKEGTTWNQLAEIVYSKFDS